MTEYTQGICMDGAAILKDGEMMTIEEILDGLRELATLKASLPKIKADAVRELIREEITVCRLRNDQKRSFIFVSDASKYANKLEAGE